MRQGGVLVHPTHLPGRYGAGDLASARLLLEWIERAGMSVWQFLPLNPPDGNGCPYNSASAFARDPMLIALEDLVRDEWLREHELPSVINSLLPIDFASARAARQPALDLAADRVAAQVDLDAWSAEHAWVDDWALFATLAKRHGPLWQAWPEPARSRRGDVLAEARDSQSWRREVALQWLFAWQWDRLRREARQRGITLWGDLPIFVAPSSADTWAHPELFELDEEGSPATVSGVPPDAFSETGQRWGHPHYRLAAHARSDHAWWRARFSALLALCDTVRIDHFRGLVGVWHIPAGDADARGGRWEAGLGAGLLEALLDEAPGDHLPVVAEDLGVITSEVVELRDRFGLPGMGVLQFAFDGGDSVHLPHRHRPNLAVYTGTHDNDTALGWYRGTREHTRRRLEAYGGPGSADEVLVRLAWSSVADTAIAPLQDLLGLDGRYRTNTPGTEDGNWRWRVPPGRMTGAAADAWAARLAVFGRSPLRR